MTYGLWLMTYGLTSSVTCGARPMSWRISEPAHVPHVEGMVRTGSWVVPASLYGGFLYVLLGAFALHLAPKRSHMGMQASTCPTFAQRECAHLCAVQVSEHWYAEFYGAAVKARQGGPSPAPAVRAPGRLEKEQPRPPLPPLEHRRR